ncbi:cysteine desulfurase [Trichococcus ilyis]|uniref:Amino acid metabolism n=1 Tax=Trichococcus ilyis TaxID=640938 RepID=A0A143Z2F9_9LACT|nr:cysteine desulfurase [Trichococcus ilyis]CZR05139.1 Hypothetical protein TR210_2195 [Trichococcus ilyis]SEJ44559.1 Putative amino acid metabolism [Trichococcus ilyis]
MAFEKKVSLKGSGKTFRLNEQVKRYTLRDNGFEETKNGNFQLVRDLDNAVLHKQGIKVKIVVAADLKTLKVSTTTSNGLKTVDVYAKDTMSAAKEQLEFILDSLVENGVLAEVSE